MVYDATFWREERNWSALTGALTGAATRKDYLTMLRHIQAVRAAGMPEERIQRAYAEVVKMIPSVPPLEVLEQGASGSAPPAAGTPPTVGTPPPASAPPTAGTPPATNETTPGGRPVRPGSSSAGVASPPASDAAAASVASAEGAPESVSGQAEAPGRAVVQQLDYWLTQLRTGDDARKIEARWNLSLIFEQRGLFAEAIEMLEGNVWAGVKDAATQRRLAACYRQIGRQDLADKAISDLYQLGMAGAATSNAPSPGPAAPTSPWATPRTGAIERVAAPAPETAAAPAPEPAPPPPWRRPRPGWLVVALTIATFGLYAYYWLFATWRELKRESDDQTMHPFWHAFGIAIIPIYGWIRFYDHIRTIRRLAISAGTGTTLSPGLCVWLFIITAVVNRLTVRIEPWTPTPPWLDLMVLGVDTILVAWPQAALTGAWKKLPGGAAPFQVHAFEWLLLILGGLVWAGVLGGVAPP